MTANSTANSETFRKFEHSGWQKVADGYHDYFASLTQQTIMPLLDAARVNEGQVVLDVATGPGYVAAAAARRKANVKGIDFSALMIAKAKYLYPTIEFSEGDAESLAFDDATFNSVVMNFGMLHLEQPEKAIAEAFRVLKSGGWFSFSVWALPKDALGFDFILKAIEAHGDGSVKLPSGPPFFRFADEAECDKTLQNAGFAKPTITKIPMKWQLASGDDYFDAFYTGTPRTGGTLRAQPPENLERIKAAATKAAAGYDGDWGLQIPMMAVVVSAQKP